MKPYSTIGEAKNSMEISGVIDGMKVTLKMIEDDDGGATLEYSVFDQDDDLTLVIKL